MAPTQLVLKHFTPCSFFSSFLPCSTMAADAVDFEELGLFPLEYFNIFHIGEEDDEDDAVVGGAEEPFLPDVAEEPFLPVDKVSGSAEEPLHDFTPPRRKRCSSCTEGSDFPT